MSDTPCPHCGERPRAPGQRWCRECRNAYRRGQCGRENAHKARRRAEAKIEAALGDGPATRDTRDTVVDTPGDTPREDTAQDSPGDGPQVEPEVAPPAGPGNARNGGNGPNEHGNGWGGWNPRSKVATRVFLAALGRNQGRATRLLIDKLAQIPEKETNPWVLMAFWREFRNAVEGTPPKATPPPDARPRSRIVVQLGPEPAPPAEVAGPPDAGSEHYEDGERFVSVPPPD